MRHGIQFKGGAFVDDAHLDSIGEKPALDVEWRRGSVTMGVPDDVASSFVDGQDDGIGGGLIEYHYQRHIHPLKIRDYVQMNNDHCDQIDPPESCWREEKRRQEDGGWGPDCGYAEGRKPERNSRHCSDVVTRTKQEHARCRAEIRMHLSRP